MRNILVILGSGIKNGNFWTFEQPIAYYRFVTKAIGWTDIGISLAPGCNGEPGKRHIDEKYLKKAYEMGNNIDKK